MYDWMDDSVTHIISALPKHCVGANSSIRTEVLQPATRERREAMTEKSISEEASKKEEKAVPLSTPRSIEMAIRSSYMS